MTRLLVLSFVTAVVAAPAFAQAPAGPCKVVFDAMLAETTTPHHAMTIKDGQPMGETISTADAMYIKLKGDWRKSPMTPKDTFARQQENIRNTIAASCTRLPDDVVDGKPATVYHTHYDEKDLGASDAKIWLSKATGLPLRTDVTLQAGEKTSVVTTFDYANIKAPIVK